MTNISDLMDPGDLKKAIADGWVTERPHPLFDLKIYNYTPKAQYERMWNDVTMNCRGLIVDGTDLVVARPFKKFFNYGEDDHGLDLDLDTPVSAYDKADGSLGIIYPTPEGNVEVATRGSFESEQAKWATAWVEAKGLVADDFFLIDKITHLCEIVYRENRIVLDYGDFEGLIGLASVEIETGKVWDCFPSFAFDRYVQPFPGLRILGDALEMSPRENAEGLVLRLGDSTHLKIKQEDYVRLHRIVSGLSEKTVWEALKDGKEEELKENVPDEMYEWFENVCQSFEKAAFDIATQVMIEHAEVVSRLPEGYTRKEFAKEAIKSDVRGHLFLYEDRKSDALVDTIWMDVKP